MKSVLRAVFLATLAVGSAAGVRWDTRGPEYAPAPEPKPGFGLVYLYRPKKQWGAAQTFITVVGERVVTLYAGTYVALVLPEGRSEIPHIGSVEAKRGTPAYVRIEFGEPVFWSKRATWLAIVRTDRFRRFATSAFDRPAVTSLSTCSSVVVRACRRSAGRVG